MSTGRKVLVLLTLVVGLVLLGCGGSGALGRNSNMSVRITRTDGTQDLTQFEVFVTKNAATSFSTLDSESYGSTTNRPSWMDNYSVTRSTTDLVLNFTTRSDQTPYYVFIGVPNTGAAFETLRFRVDVDGNTGNAPTYNIPINGVTRLTNVQINRNSASY